MAKNIDEEKEIYLNEIPKIEKRNDRWILNKSDLDKIRKSKNLEGINLKSDYFNIDNYKSKYFSSKHIFEYLRSMHKSINNLETDKEINYLAEWMFKCFNITNFDECSEIDELNKTFMQLNKDFENNLNIILEYYKNKLIKYLESQIRSLNKDLGNIYILNSIKYKQQLFNTYFYVDVKDALEQIEKLKSLNLEKLKNNVDPLSLNLKTLIPMFHEFDIEINEKDFMTESFDMPEENIELMKQLQEMEIETPVFFEDVLKIINSMKIMKDFINDSKNRINQFINLNEESNIVDQILSYTKKLEKIYLSSALNKSVDANFDDEEGYNEALSNYVKEYNLMIKKYPLVHIYLNKCLRDFEKIDDFLMEYTDRIPEIMNLYHKKEKNYDPIIKNTIIEVLFCYIESLEDKIKSIPIDHKSDSVIQYQSLNDIYPKGKTEIWYFKPNKDVNKNFMLFEINKLKLPKNYEDIAKTHILLGSINEIDKEKIFYKLQGEIWSPNGEARSLIKKLGLNHTSMSVGDIIVFNKKEGYICSMTGFKRLF